MKSSHSMAYVERYKLGDLIKSSFYGYGIIRFFDPQTLEAKVHFFSHGQDIWMQSDDLFSIRCQPALKERKHYLQ